MSERHNGANPPPARVLVGETCVTVHVLHFADGSAASELHVTYGGSGHLERRPKTLANIVHEQAERDRPPHPASAARRGAGWLSAGCSRGDEGWPRRGVSTFGGRAASAAGSRSATRPTDGSTTSGRRTARARGASTRRCASSDNRRSQRDVTMLDPALRRGLVLVVVQFDPGDNATCPERETTLDALYALRRFTWSPLVDIPGRIRDSTLARRAVRELKATAA